MSIFTGMLVATSAVATPSETTVEGMAWRTESATQFPKSAAVAASREEQILVWDNGRGAQTADSVVLLAEVPYQEVQPVVQHALERFGKLTIHVGDDSLAYLPDDWDRVLLSRRADLRNALVERFTLPHLQRAVALGALTQLEMEQWLARASVRLDSIPQNRDASVPADRHALESFRVTYPHWSATQYVSYGLFGRQESTLSVDISDVTAMFGHPATSVRIHRRDSYPNPDYHPLATFFSSNFFARTPSPTRTDSVVPAPVFVAVREALAGLSGHVEIALSPLAWVQPVPPITATPTLALVAPASDVPVIKAQAIRWDSLVTDQRSLLYPHDLLALPDGDLLFSSQVLDDAGWSQRVWRLHQADNDWKAEELWRGSEGTTQLSLSADGRTAWFDGANTRQANREWFAYDVGTRLLTRHAVTWPDAHHYDLNNPRWELAGDQLPAVFTHDYSLGNNPKNPLGHALLSVLRPTAPPPSSSHDAWPFANAFSSARQSMMKGMKGNAQIWPVRWRAPKSFWVEDQPGIAELDAVSGRVLRAVALPQRFLAYGSPDRLDATGVAQQGVPKPLGSPEAGWIATGFVLKLADDGSRLPSSANDDGNLVGMHVVNLKDEHVLSALAGRAGTLAAVARSAHGQFLALGANGMRRSGSRVALWDIAQARTPVQLETSSRSELHALAFAWNGADLWALGDRELFRWSLPESLRDAAGQGSFPDQSN